MGKPRVEGFRVPQLPPRRELPAPDVERFVREVEAESAGPEPLDKRRALRREEKGERVTVYLPPEMITGLRVRCASERRSMSDAVTEAVGAWLASVASDKST